jgi:hypothetical protein
VLLKYWFANFSLVSDDVYLPAVGNCDDEQQFSFWLLPTINGHVAETEA